MISYILFPKVKFSFCNNPKTNNYYIAAHQSTLDVMSTLVLTIQAKNIF